MSTVLPTGLIPTYMGEPMIPAPRPAADLPPLPARLSPRPQPPAQRAVWWLIAAVTGAVICGMVLMQARYGADISDVSR